MEDVQDCAITDEEWNWFLKEYQGITPCLEYGMCEACPYSKQNNQTQDGD